MERFLLPEFCFDKDGGGASPSPAEPKPAEPKANEPGAQEPKAEEPDLEELKKALAGKDEEISRLKAQQAGEYRRGKELQRQIDELKKAQMSEAERKKAEEEELAKKRQEERERFLGECVTLAAERSGIKPEDSFLLSAESQEDIFKKGARLKELLAEAEAAGYEKAKKDQVKGPPPGGGEPSGGVKSGQLGATTLESLNNLK